MGVRKLGMSLFYRTSPLFASPKLIVSVLFSPQVAQSFVVEVRLLLGAPLNDVWEIMLTLDAHACIILEDNAVKHEGRRVAKLI